MNNINYNNFKNICRTCMLTCDLKFTPDNVILGVFYNLTGIPFEINDELPKQICRKCFEKINEIHSFALQCKQTHLSLINCLNKNTRVKEESDEQNEHNIEFVQVEANPTFEELQIKSEIIEETNDQLNEFPETSHQNYFHDNPSINIESFTDVFSNVNSSENNKNKGKRYVCDICNKIFIHYASFRGHKSVHSTERPFECNFCGKKFKLQTHLVAHERLHTNSCFYKCNICDKTYKLSSDLLVHKRIHRNERAYKCDICNKTFTLYHVLLRHKKLHSGECPYKCDVCNKSFTEADTLKNHMKTHSGETPFECDVCQKTFKFAHVLMRHKRLHSGERPYHCDVCNKKFMRLDNFNRHKKLHE